MPIFCAFSAKHVSNELVNYIMLSLIEHYSNMIKRIVVTSILWWKNVSSGLWNVPFRGSSHVKWLNLLMRNYMLKLYFIIFGECSFKLSVFFVAKWVWYMSCRSCTKYRKTVIMGYFQDKWGSFRWCSKEKVCQWNT